MLWLALPLDREPKDFRQRRPDGQGGWTWQVKGVRQRCAGLDVHKNTVVACVRVAVEGKVHREMRTFDTTTTAHPEAARP